MTDVFFSNQDHEIKIKRFVCVKQIKFSFFSHSWNQGFYSWYMQNVKTDLYRNLNFQSNLVAQRLKLKFGSSDIFKNLPYRKNILWLASYISPKHFEVSQSRSENVIKWTFGGNLMYFISYLTDILTMTDFFALPSNF